MSQFIKETETSEKKHQTVHTLHNKTECQIYKVSFTAFVKPIPQNLTVLVSTKFANQNLSNTTDEDF